MPYHLRVHRFGCLAATLTFLVAVAAPIDAVAQTGPGEADVEEVGLPLSDEVDSVLLDFAIELQGLDARFVPGDDAPPAATTSITPLQIVQFAGPVQQSDLDGLEALGVTPLRYLPQHAYLVEASRDVTLELRASPPEFVRWVGNFEDRYKLNRSLQGLLDTVESDEAIVFEEKSPQQLASGKLVRDVATPKAQSAWYSVQIADTQDGSRRAAAKDRLLSRLAAAGIDQHRQVAGPGIRSDLKLTKAQLARVLSWPEVVAVDPWSDIGFDMDLVNLVSGADMVGSIPSYVGEDSLGQTVLGYNGQGLPGEDGVRIEVYDTGIHHGFSSGQPLAHEAFEIYPPIIRSNQGNDPDDISHGTQVAGIVFGYDPSGWNPFNYGPNNFLTPGGWIESYAHHGLIDRGQGIFNSTDFSPQQLGYLDRLDMTMALVTDPTLRAVAQTNSHGATQVTDYNTFSAEMDDIVYQTDLVITQSQSNTHSQLSRPQAWAKNVVSVGGVYHYGDLLPGNDTWEDCSGFACEGPSHGPAEDGRVKPDLVYHYDDTFTTRSQGGYRDFCCTSAATPSVAGTFGLFFEMWADNSDDGVRNIFGQAVSGNSVFAKRPPASTAKAFMINTAIAYKFADPSDPDYVDPAAQAFWGSASERRFKQGWGKPNLSELYDRRESVRLIPETVPLRQGRVYRRFFWLPNGRDDLRATLVYRDPPGVPGVVPHRINDLDLRLISPTGQVYRGNVGLLTGDWSTTGGSHDSVNTVENVFVQNPRVGLWRVVVFAREVNQDTVAATAALDADFSLVLTSE